jgi:GTPase involved in cell partitioning and DNA repair
MWDWLVFLTPVLYFSCFLRAPENRAVSLHNVESAYRLADIPGLIRGAHEDVGLGHKFLRHIERCKMIVYIIDAAGVDCRNPADDLKDLQTELRLFKPEILEKPSLVIANKMDLASTKNLESIKSSTSLDVIGASAKCACQIKRSTMNAPQKSYQSFAGYEISHVTNAIRMTLEKKCNYTLNRQLRANRNMTSFDIDYTKF